MGFMHAIELALFTGGIGTALGYYLGKTFSASVSADVKTLQSTVETAAADLKSEAAAVEKKL